MQQKILLMKSITEQSFLWMLCSDGIRLSEVRPCHAPFFSYSEILPETIVCKVPLQLWWNLYRLHYHQ